MSVSIAGGFLNDALKKFEQQVSQPEAQMGVTTGRVSEELAPGAAGPSTEQSAAPEELEKVSQLPDDLLYHMLKSISYSTEGIAAPGELAASSTQPPLPIGEGIAASSMQPPLPIGQGAAPGELAASSTQPPLPIGEGIAASSMQPPLPIGEGIAAPGELAASSTQPPLPIGEGIAASSMQPPLPIGEGIAAPGQGAAPGELAASSTPPPLPTAAEQPAELAAEAAELAKVSQLSDDLLHHMLESISDSTDSALLPKVLSNTQKNISDDDNYLLSFKQYTNAEQYTDYTIYYKDNDEALNTGTNFLDKSFNYFVYSPDGTNVKITPIKKYYTLNDILKHICNLFDNIIIISKKISSSPISVLYQYKDYKHKSLIFIYNSTYNDILKNIRGFIDIIPQNTRPDNPITIDEYNSIKTEIYNE